MKHKRDTNRSRTVGSLDAILALVAKTLREPLVRKATVSKLQALIWDGRESVVGLDIYNVLADLAHDLDFYEPDPIRRCEDPSYFGGQRLEDEIRTVLKRLTALGIEVLRDPSFRRDE